jgi:hypothetical protein
MSYFMLKQVVWIGSTMLQYRVGPYTELDESVHNLIPHLSTLYCICYSEAEDFSSSLCVQTGSGAHPASCSMGTGGPFPGGKARAERDADHSPPSSAEVNNQ